MKKIFFVGNLNSSFINNDYTELQKHFDVKHAITKLYLNLSILEVIKGIYWCDTVYGWFASWRMILPIIFAKIFNKKIIVVAGGYDVACEPEINYGAFTTRIGKAISLFVLRNADIVLPVSRSTYTELLVQTVPKKTILVYNGVDCKKFYSTHSPKIDFVITVGEINWSNLKRKGIEDFVKAANYNQNLLHIVIGGFKDNAIDYLKSIAGSNVIFTGYVDSESLLNFYQHASVYAQLSYHEGFGISVAEAMLCGCIPVVSDKGALSEVVGNFGHTTLYGSPALAAAYIRAALQRKNVSRDLIRNRIVLNFSLEKRIQKLKEIL